jgi:NDP-sugar pyrophosphorylase family protein
MPVGDMPVLEVVLRQLEYYGVRRVTITTGHLAHLIQAFFGDGSRWGLTIDYVTETRPLGTVGAVRLVRDLDEAFLMMNGDLLTSLDYGKLYRYHRRQRAPFTVATYQKAVPIDLGVIDLDARNRVRGFREKPTLEVNVSMGIYVLEPEALKLIPAGRYFGFDDLMRAALARGTPPAIYRFDGSWYDIGRPSDYEVASAELARHRRLYLPGSTHTRRRRGRG